jgi:hypothetical protein
MLWSLAASPITACSSSPPRCHHTDFAILGPRPVLVEVKPAMQ